MSKPKIKNFKIETLKDLKGYILKVTLKVWTFFQFAFKMVVPKSKNKNQVTHYVSVITLKNCTI